MALLAAAAAACAAGEPAPGPFSVEQAVLTDCGLQPGSEQVSRDFTVTWPTNSTGGSSVVLFAHGFMAGGVLLQMYDLHFREIASHGFVVVAPSSCTFSCGAPWFGGWQSFAWEIVRGYNFAQNAWKAEEDWAKTIDFSRGAACIGHSLGAEACVLASSLGFAPHHEVRVAVLQHGFGPTVDGAGVSSTAPPVRRPQTSRSRCLCSLGTLIGRCRTTEPRNCTRGPGSRRPSGTSGDKDIWR
eukprot:TRINITY_DN29654_c0_g1_i1.p1 TRINITY_DN29654_c0_g1~~TRINITY_DN29654_c0_g1_i1.p1  ORF type:complete len:256 (+),score=37.09 TRINITY_DN29654_c0_g1_i1:44-769(+)